MNFKVIQPAILLLFFLQPCAGQGTWFPEGATWHYSYHSYSGEGFTKLEVLQGDTLIGARPYKKILSTTIASSFGPLDTFIEVLYVFEQENVVHGYDQWSGHTFLYDFNAQIGDTLPMYFGGLSPGPFVVDSVGVLVENANSLKFQDIRFPKFNENGFNEMRVVEGIGSISSHLFHDHTIIQPFDAGYYYFRCYEDAIIGLVDFSVVEVDCDFLYNSTPVANYLAPEIFIYPNPVSSFLRIQMERQPANKICIVDAMGHIVFQEDLSWQWSDIIDLSHLPTGIYFIIVRDGGHRILYSAKFLKTE